MAVGANSYGTVAGVEKLVGDLVTGRAFSGSTVPTTTQVEGVIDDAAADLNRELEAAGFTAPVVVGDDPTAHAFLVAANNYGASAVIMGMLPTSSYSPDMEAEGETRAGMYQRRFNHALKMIRENRLKAARATERMGRLFGGGQEDSDGETKKPLFTRGMHDYPGVRSLTE